ncbi:hypothetical protein D4764_04G0013110 [Takifugu flavidus]|uniref:Uncharacterized protein n=1 Tax=Takifugu flavidus TaxID=433684 RepID=A0A5C6N5C4_9TELE|nr:hypothetical protein D4764_04G0013110 [Takifugu flavidus]
MTASPARTWPCKPASPIEYLPEPRPIHLNGEVLAMVTHQSHPLTLNVSGNLWEQIPLFLIPPSSSLGVLGAPWLALHNSQIDWSTGRVVSWSMPCWTNCLHSALTTMPGGSDLSKRVFKGVGRSPRVAQSRCLESVMDSAVGGELLRSNPVDRTPSYSLPASWGSWQVEERVPEAQQSVLDPGGVPSNQLFVLEDKVVAPSVQTDVHRCRRVGRQVRAVLPALSTAGKAAPPAFKIQPTFHVSKVKPVVESDLVPLS